MVLLIEPVGIARTQADAMGIVESDIVYVEAVDHFHPVDQRRPFFSAVGGLVYAPARHRNIHMLRVARIYRYGMQFGTIRCPILRAAHPGLILRIGIQTRKRRPGFASVFRAKQALRRRPGIPNAGFVGVSGFKPEGVIDGTGFGALCRLGEGWRFFCFAPAAPHIRRTKNSRTEMAGFCRGEKRFPVARVEHQVMNDMAKKMRP